MTEFTKDPSTHPANDPLRVERLIRVRDELADAAKAIDELLAVQKSGQEPVAYMQIDGDEVEYNGHNEFSGGGKGVPLYAAPPQPAVPDENGLLRCPFCGSAARVVDNRLGFYVQCCSDNCDGLAIGPRVPELQSEQEEKSIDWEALAQAAKDKWNRRAAMLQGAEPVSQTYKLRDGWVMVPVDPTAEMISSGIAAHYERSQIQINDRPAPGPMECAYMAMVASAPQQEVKK